MAHFLIFAFYWLAFWLAVFFLARQMPRLARWVVDRRCRALGTRLDGGSPEPSASTGMKEPGTRTPAMATTAGCSSLSLRGEVLEVWSVPTSPHRANSFTELGVSTPVIRTRGANGARPGSAD